jgi:hypothetical protein
VKCRNGSGAFAFAGQFRAARQIESVRNSRTSLWGEVLLGRVGLRSLSLYVAAFFDSEPVSTWYEKMR